MAEFSNTDSVSLALVIFTVNWKLMYNMNGFEKSLYSDY